ncbi:hypothetical protein L6R53_06795 [Myxococcota bacterium]|nr:hypothetical protein [Myxococcota bacterium]
MGDLATGVLSPRLEEAVSRGAAVLAVGDQPNANMARELGMAMARGRPFALASEAAEIGRSWLDDTPLASVLRQPDICEHARELLRKLSDFAQAPPPLALSPAW